MGMPWGTRHPSLRVAPLASRHKLIIRCSRKPPASRSHIIHGRVGAAELQALLRGKGAKKLGLDGWVQLHTRAAKLCAAQGPERQQLLHVMQQAEQLMLGSITNCKPWHLAAILDNLARVQADPASLLVQSVMREVCKLRALTPGQLCSIAAAVSRHTQRLVTRAAIADPTRTIMTVTTIREQLEAMWELLTSQAIALADVMQPKEAGKFLAALARARHYDAQALTALLACVERHIAPAGPLAGAGLVGTAAPSTLEVLSDVLWAQATFLYHEPPVFLQLATTQLQALTPDVVHPDLVHPDINTHVHGTGAQLQLSAAPTLTSSTAACTDAAQSAPASCPAPHVLVNMAWSAAVVGQATPEAAHLISTVCYLLCSHHSNATTQQVSSQPHNSPATRTHHVASEGTDADEPVWMTARPYVLAQLFQALLLVSAYQGLPATEASALVILQHLPCQHQQHVQQLVRRCVECWKETAKQSTPSATQMHVSKVLKALTAQPVCEYVTPDGLFCVDILANWKGQQVVVEVDGPPHFCASPAAARSRPLGATQARRVLLESRGWAVVQLNTDTWHALGRLEAHTPGDDSCTSTDPNGRNDVDDEMDSSQGIAICTPSQLLWLKQLLCAAVSGSQQRSET